MSSYITIGGAIFCCKITVPVAEGKHPTGGTSVWNEAEVDLSLINRAKNKEDTYNYYYYKNIKPEIFGS